MKDHWTFNVELNLFDIFRPNNCIVCSYIVYQRLRCCDPNHMAYCTVCTLPYNLEQQTQKGELWTVTAICRQVCGTAVITRVRPKGKISWHELSACVGCYYNAMTTVICDLAVLFISAVEEVCTGAWALSSARHNLLCVPSFHSQSHFR